MLKSKDHPRDRFAAFVTVGTKGQIVIPNEVRKMFNITSGSRVIILADSKRGIVITSDKKVMDKMSKVFMEYDEE